MPPPVPPSPTPPPGHEEGPRLLYLVPDGFPTHRADVTVLFGQELPRHGIATDLVAQQSLNASADAAWPAGTLSVAPRGASPARNQLGAFLHDLRQLWRARPDRYAALQVRDKPFAGLLGLIRARLLGLPFFYWASFPICESYAAVARAQGARLGLARWFFLMLKGHVGQRLLYRWLMPRCDHVFVQSDRMKEELVARGIPPNKLTPVPMGVDLERATRKCEVRIDAGALAGKRVIGYLGTLERARRIDFLFEVVARLRQDIPDICLLLVGDAEEADDRRFLAERAAEIGVTDCIVHTGWVPSATAWAWMRKAELGLSLFPRGELLDSASPTKVVEYLALGIPVIGNDQPDQQQVLTASGAGISVPMEVDGFADAIRTVLRDPELAARMSAAGPPFVRANRTYAGLGRELALVYHRLLGTSVSLPALGEAASDIASGGGGGSGVNALSVGAATLAGASTIVGAELRASVELPVARSGGPNRH
ncbi:glycosyltransferase family 4 protein [Derxia lacustris]|uniref:glycosyltransferase family 4 protein n=1 Tax=Derxia lacustris TaxID=764842 RepID=UPI000A176109|nr:glycosyltransferase family 4 protein [Derxia lacustris]